MPTLLQLLLATYDTDEAFGRRSTNMTRAKLLCKRTAPLNRFLWLDCPLPTVTATDKWVCPLRKLVDVHDQCLLTNSAAWTLTSHRIYM
jgi:hypothetical protein